MKTSEKSSTYPGTNHPITDKFHVVRCGQCGFECFSIFGEPTRCRKCGGVMVEVEDAVPM